MSDGPSDCAYAAEARALKFVEANYKGVKQIHTPTAAPARGTVILIYEEWLQHVVEVVTDRKVTQRYLAEPFKEVRQMPITKDDWPVGYYRDNHIPRKGQ